MRRMRSPRRSKERGMRSEMSSGMRGRTMS